MAYKNYLVKVLKLIALITFLSGLLQLLFPSLVLGLMSADITPSTEHFFGIVGMFMALFGGLLFHSVRGKKLRPVPVLWCGLQKFGAVIAIILGISRGLFSWMAIGVAGFDLISGVLILIYWFSIQDEKVEANLSSL